MSITRETYSGAVVPELVEGAFYVVVTSAGTEIVPASLMNNLDTVKASDLLGYLEGGPEGPDYGIQAADGWLARVVAVSGSQTSAWSSHLTQEEAAAYLQETWGLE